MKHTAKVLIPNKEWLVQEGSKKVGTLTKDKRGYVFYNHGNKVSFKDLNEMNTMFGSALFEENLKNIIHKKPVNDKVEVCGFPCKEPIVDPVYDVQRKLPLFIKEDGSKSQHCAGYFVIKQRKGWYKSFCPKLIKIERYPFFGPFKTEKEADDWFERLVDT